MKASPTTTSKKRGRKTILDAKLQKQICDLLAAGNKIRTCVDAVGISERVYFEWCERYPHFAQATTRARADAKIKLVKVITDASALDWKSAAWLLERCWPDEFGRSEPRTIIVERAPIPQAERPPQSLTTNYWRTTKNEEIPFTREQLAYIAEMRTRYAEAPPSKSPNGKKEDR